MLEDVGPVDCVSDDNALLLLHVGQVHLTQSHVCRVDQATLPRGSASQITHFRVLDFGPSTLDGNT